MFPEIPGEGNQLLETVEIEPAGKATGAVIWLHGLGADGHDFEPIVPELQLSGDVELRFVFPHAPVRPVTLNGGMPMRAWYDIVGLDRKASQDEAGIRASAAELDTLVRRECERGLTLGNIAVAGFSQGGAIALHAGLRYPARLAGIMGLSTYLPMEDTLLAERSSANADVPVFMGHGAQDPVLPIQMGQHSCEVLQSNGYPVEWHQYMMAHSVCPEEIRHIREWLLGIF